MKFIEKLGRQPRSWLMVEALVCLVGIGCGDMFTTWRFSLFVFYCVPVYIVALFLPRRIAIGFVLLTTVVSLVANLDAIPVRGIVSFAWSGVNRTIGFLMATACGVWFGNFRREMQGRIEELQRAQKLERDILSAGERERERIGQDLHDGVCQTLAALDCGIECLKLDLEADGSPHTGVAHEIQQQLAAATREVRNVAWGIYPVSITENSLSTAVQSLVITTNRFFRGTVSIRADDSISLKNREVALQLYRITQEALSNAVRHSNATHVEVDLQQNSEELSLIISDNGSGSAMAKPTEGMGLETMRYRSNLIGANLTVQSVPSRGTTVSCKMLLQQPRVSLPN